MRRSVNRNTKARLDHLKQKGIEYLQQGRLIEATHFFRESCSIDASDAECWNLIGIAYGYQSCFEMAIACCEKAVELNPDHGQYYFNLGQAYLYKRKLDAAANAYRDVIRLTPEHLDAYRNLGYVLQCQGKVDEAIHIYRKVLDKKPDYTEAHSNLLFAMNYSPAFDNADIYFEHRRWGEIIANRTKPYAEYPNHPDPERCINIGYVSPDFRQHSVAYFIEPIIENHTKAQFSITCYSDHQTEDTFTKRIKTFSSAWRNIQGWPDDRLAEQIRRDKIDILVDLAGHTSSNRLQVFARKPAPIQISYLGYPTTTGLTTIDYRLTDAYVNPPNRGHRPHTEVLIYLPTGFLCYKAPRDAPTVSDVPSAQIRHITFGSFNNLTKVTPDVFSTWARILKAIPSARLLLKNNSLIDKATRENCYQKFSHHQIERERLELKGTVSDFAEHLSHYQLIDVALDTFPYNGTTTTCEALWMGVPVVSLKGETDAGRVGMSLLGRIGHTELVAGSIEDYIDIAVKLAQATKKRAGMRMALRKELLETGICDGRSFVLDLENAYRTTWIRWCEENT